MWLIVYLQLSHWLHPICSTGLRLWGPENFVVDRMCAQSCGILLSEKLRSINLQDCILSIGTDGEEEKQEKTLFHLQRSYSCVVTVRGGKIRKFIGWDFKLVSLQCTFVGANWLKHSKGTSWDFKIKFAFKKPLRPPKFWIKELGDAIKAPEFRADWVSTGAESDLA